MSIDARLSTWIQHPKMFFVATVVVGVANGLIEAAINPLIATIYSEDKTRRLVALHAWFPGGLVADLEALLGRRVDVVEAAALRPEFRDAVLREAVLL